MLHNLCQHVNVVNLSAVGLIMSVVKPGMLTFLWQMCHAVNRNQLCLHQQGL